MKQPDNHRRDLELILLGVVLVKQDGQRSADGQRVLDSLPHGSYSKELEPLFDAVRNANPYKMTVWLEERQAAIEKGKDAVQAVIDSIHQRNETEAICSIARTLSLLPRSQDKEQMKEVLRNALERLEKL